MEELHFLIYCVTGVPCCPIADPYGISQSCQEKQTRGNLLCVSVGEVMSAAFYQLLSI